MYPPSLSIWTSGRILSRLHVHDLHPVANLHSEGGGGVKFAPGCCFGHVNGVFRFLSRVQISPSFEVVHPLFAPGANCAHERKMFNFYSFYRGF